MDEKTTRGAPEQPAKDGAASAGPTLPAVTLPKGGGALRGLGEKVTVSPTGSASLSVPLPISAARAPSGTPSLALSYDSASGNGPFGLGWTMALPAIARKTEKALPRYLDGEDSDVFVLSGFEDLVPVLVAQADGTWTRETFERDGFRVDRYRPRIEGGFARIERWTDRHTGDAYWRSITKDNVSSVYGRSTGARICDPNDPRRIYKWLLEETTDDQGNVVAYEYRQEDAVSIDTQSPSERNRVAFANRYLKYVHYGNQTPFVAGDWHFELVFDYGDHHPDVPELAPDRAWPARRDPFSSYRSGFDIRTYRLCRRVLMFHVFEELRAPAQLISALELRHAESPIVTTVTSFVRTGYTFDATGYHAKSLPALELAYSAPAADPQLQVLDRRSAAGLPAGLAAPYQWVDLDSEGLSGVLTEQGNGWFYKRNLGGGQLGDLELVAQRPRGGLRAGAQLLDLANDGRKYLVEMSGPLPGAYRREHDPDTWAPFAPFESMPVLDWTSKYQRLLDLDGDGLADVLVTEDGAWSWYPSLGTVGFGPRESVPVARDEERGPTLVFADPSESIFLADLVGDGLVDLVRVRNGDICYWPNLGYGRFGAKVTMTDAPVFDRPELFDPRRVRFCDIDGTGAVDVLYLDRGSIRYWLNTAGNGWSGPHVFDQLPEVDNLASIAALDFLGNGTSCVVWSSPAPRDAGRPLAYLDLMGGQKPYLLASLRTNLGVETAIAYAPSTEFYVEDRASGTPWVTRVPFPVQVVARIETRDAVTGNKFVSSYTYHHGYYDGPEQEFRGFGRVDQLDTEAYEPFAGAGLLPPGSNADGALHVPPVLTRTWYHTGAYLDDDRISTQLAHEYWKGDPDPQAAVLDDTELAAGLTTAELVEACRALKGQVLRQEVYALDDTPRSLRPYSVTERNFAVVRVQPFGDNPHASFFTHPREVLELAYERAEVPDPRVLHTFTLEVDAVGNVCHSAAVAYARRGAAPFPEQAAIAITTSEVDVINVADQLDMLRLGVPLESRSYEIVPPLSGPIARYTFDALDGMLAALTEVPVEAIATPGTRRLLSRSQATYYRDDLSGPLPLGQCGTRALPYQSYRLALTPGLVTALWGDRVTDAMLAGDGKYELRDGAWWAPSGRGEPSPAAFYRTLRFFDPFGNVGSVAYDKYALLVERTESSDDPVLANVTTVENDYRTLGPWRVTDPNGNRAAVRTDALGLVIATAIMGKATGPAEGDTLDDPTTRYEYNLDVVPAWGHQLAREQHGAANTRWLESYEYSDGFGRVVQKKAQAEPDPVTQAPRWVGTGRTIFNNKGLAVKKYEPFFSATLAYEDEPTLVASGVTPIMHYDPIGRVVRTDLPDGSYSRVEVDAWSSASWDPNDTVLDSRWYQDHTSPTASADEQRAAQLTAAHAGTPTITHVDPLGRTFLSILDNGPDGTYQTRNVIDVEGRTVAVVDDAGRTIAAYRYDLLGLRGYASLLDSGERWTLVDVAGKPIRSWDSRGHARRLSYDRLQRATHAYLSIDGGAEVLVQRTVYGERVASAAAANLRGQSYQLYDGAGVVTSRDYDFKGHLRTGERRVANNFQTLVDWSPLAELDDPAAIATAAEPFLEPNVFATTTGFDALERIARVTTSDGSIIMPAYNVASLLERTTVSVRGDAAHEYVRHIEYDAKGRRTRIDYGTAQTEYTYDPFTFRTVTATTIRKSDSATLQALTYTYDPIGNVVAIVDGAQPTIYFKNAVVSPSTTYVYDAVYRLREADGREHVGLFEPVGFDDGPRVQQPSPGDGQAMQRYHEAYTYDAVGNLLQLVHTAAQGSWNRPYHYDGSSNQLRWTDVATSAYAYDAHGNTTSMPHLASMTWNDSDQLSKVDLGGGGTAYYTYASNGQRVRKVIVSLGGAIRERIYLGGYEVYRERAGASVSLERQSLHVMDDSHRVALVETLVRDQGVDIADPVPTIRYQLDNHLGSAVLEVDDDAAVISYEEYYPYGSTSYQAGRNASETSLKRYRYIGKERDDETGFCYYGARYYAPWIARWIACDPIGIADAASLYVYARCSPIAFRDPNGKQSESSCIYVLSHPVGSPVSGLYPGPDCVIKQEPLVPEFHRPGSTGPIRPSPPPPPKVVHKPPKSKPEPPKEKPVSIETLETIAWLSQPHYHYDPFAERVFGTGQAALGLLELGGAVLTSETVVGAAVLGAQAGDDLSTGVGQIISGKHEDSMKFKLGHLLTAQVTDDKQWQNVGGQSFEMFGNAGVGAVGMWEASRGISLAPSLAAEPTALERFTAQFYASKGQLLNQQASEIADTVRPMVKRKGFLIGVSTSFVDGEQLTVVTASNPEAWAALGEPGVLPPGMQRGPNPAPFITKGKLADLKHVEFLGPEWLGDRGAKAAIVGTSSPACLGSCTPIWTHPTLSPTDIWHTNVPGLTLGTF